MQTLFLVVNTSGEKLFQIDKTLPDGGLRLDVILPPTSNHQKYKLYPILFYLFFPTHSHRQSLLFLPFLMDKQNTT